MRRAADRYRQNEAGENHDAITARDENTYALEGFASEEELSPEAANAQPATDPLSEFDSEEATPPQPDVMTDPFGGMQSENFQLSQLPDHHVALTTRIEMPARRRPFEVKGYAALAARIGAAAAIGLTIVGLDLPTLGIAFKTAPSEPTAIRATAFTANHFPFVPALPAVSPTLLHQPSSDSPISAQSDVTKPTSATRLTRRDTIVAAELIPASGVLPQPAVAVADAPAVAPTLIAATPVGPSAIAVPAVRRTTPLAPVDNLPETELIQTALGRYQGAFRALDSVAASAVWPTVDRKALSRAFERLEEQRIEFDKCQIAVEGPRAVASCDGRTRYVPKVGNRSPRTEARHWRFTLLRLDEEWLIDEVESR